MKKGLAILLFLVFYLFTFSQENDSVQRLKEVSISLIAPITHEKISTKTLAPDNLGQDLTYLLKNETSVLTTSDAGAGIGYTGIRIRGTDPTRINVTLNDVPINDSESQAVFWVNMPDLTTASSSIAITRGVGTSTNGTAAFGASIGIQSKPTTETPDLFFALSGGSFTTAKYSLRVGTGKFLKNFYLNGGLSYIHSDGYIDRAFSNLFSYNYKLSFKNEKNEISFFNFGGKEKTYQAWYGVDAQTVATDRTFNPAGAIYNKEYSEIIGFYDNQTDNYRQDHYHLTWKHQFSEHWSMKNTLHYTKGKGYYEEYIQDANLKNYLITPTEEYSDLIRQKWLNNDFYGLQLNLLGKSTHFQTHFGLAANQYFGRHFGRVVSVLNSPDYQPSGEYYYNESVKNEVSGFAKVVFRWKQFDFFGDVHYRHIFYKAYIPGQVPNSYYESNVAIRQTYDFLNPKVGVSYLLNQGKLYLSFAMAHREPTRTDFLESETTPRPERLYNVELGITKTFPRFNFQFNTYAMLYHNQLVLTGNLDEVGNAIRENVGKSYRLGMETALNWKTFSFLELFANLNASLNKILDYTDYIGTSVENLGTKTLTFSPALLTNFGFECTFLKNFHLRMNNQYVGYQYLSNSNTENSQLPDYFLSDATLYYKKIFSKKQELSFSFLVGNIFNRLYSNNGYYSEGNPYFYPQAGRNFLVGMSLKF